MRVEIGYRVLKTGCEILNKHKVETSVKKFNKFVEQNKDQQAYSDYKEGVNKGLDIAKYTFEENAEKFCIFEENAEKFCILERDGDQAVKINCLHDNFCQLIDRIVMAKKPNWSEDHFEGLCTGFEKSKEIFRKFITESFPAENI